MIQYTVLLPFQNRLSIFLLRNEMALNRGDRLTTVQQNHTCEDDHTINVPIWIKNERRQTAKPRRQQLRDGTYIAVDPLGSYS